MSYQLVQALLEKHVSFLQARENWGNSILAAGLWPDSVPSALFATEDSHLSVVRSDGQILVYCLNRISMKTSSWTRSADSSAYISLVFSQVFAFTYNSQYTQYSTQNYVTLLLSVIFLLL